MHRLSTVQAGALVSRRKQFLVVAMIVVGCALAAVGRLIFPQLPIALLGAVIGVGVVAVVRLILGKLK
ncbi:hypothetical protein [Sinomonas gamaensis]|uniref:hypothetical protein n=1 Tax=Sinomonas gamaensis TaxID=2565624 RepID=UPI0014861315|nr:hypothetical protein [Sinomonas gamaensis]